MTSLSELSVISGASIPSLKILKRFGLDFEDDNFEMDEFHLKAIFELRRKRVSPYVIAYALLCRADGQKDDFARYDNIVAISKIRGVPISDALSDVRARQVELDLLPAAKFWIDRANTPERHPDAFERIALWCKKVLTAGPSCEVDHTYLAVRLLMSLPREDMRTYPILVHRALNRTKHHGLLDGWYRLSTDENGKPKSLYFRPAFDL